MRASWGFGIVMTVGLTVVAIGCGDDDDGPGKGEAKGGSGGQGGSAGRRPMTRGGTGGFAPGGGQGGDTGIDPNESAYLCKPPAPATGGSLREGEACCGSAGVCTRDPSGPGSQDWGYDLCTKAAGLRCAPVEAAESMEDAGVVDPTECRMMYPDAPAGAPTFEGRCITGCFLTESPIVMRITASTCAAGQYCAPCYNPISGESTGHCERNGDSPKEPAPKTLLECGNGTGLCVPAYAAGQQAMNLPQLTCAAGELCAPLAKVANPQACFPRCDGGDLGPGACVPTFLVPEFITGLLSPGSCGTSELCAPCAIAGQRIGVCD